MTSFVAAVQDAERAQLIVDLKAARAELVARGRCREDLVDEASSKVCVLGALGVATVENFVGLSCPSQGMSLGERRPTRARAALERRLRQQQDDCGVEVWAFNDDPRTTDQDVLDLFDKTLADLGGLA